LFNNSALSTRVNICLPFRKDANAVKTAKAERKRKELTFAGTHVHYMIIVYSVQCSTNISVAAAAENKNMPIFTVVDSIEGA
jgi:hypothetical protein